MKYLQLNPETNPVRHEFMDGVEIQSVTNSHIYGYWSDDGGLLPVQEPGFYVHEGNELVNLDSYITSVDKTEEYIESLPQDWRPPQTDEYYMSVSACTYVSRNGVSLVYLVKTHAGGTDAYGLEDADGDYNYQVWYAGPERPYYTGTYNLADGSSVEITEMRVDGDNVLMYDSQGRLHETSYIIDYQYYTIPGHGDLYFDKLSGDWCHPDGNGKYTMEGRDGLFRQKGFDFVITYGDGTEEEHYTEYGPRENPPYYANMTATTIYTGHTEPWNDDPDWYNKDPEDRVPVEYYTGVTTGWTVVTLNYGHDIRYKDENGDDVYAVWQLHQGLVPDLWTGHTMEDLQWWSDDYDEHPSDITYRQYEIVKIPAEEDKIVTEYVVPGVAFENTGNTVYYNRTGVPVYDLDLDVNFFAVPRDAVFDMTMHKHILYYRDFGAGAIRLAPAAVEGLWIDGVDKTAEFKNGTITDVDLWKNRYNEGKNVINAEEIRVLFTEQFFMNGRLNATKEEGNR